MSNFTGVTFAQQKVLPSDDAIIRRSLLSDGFLYGCELSYSGSTLTMAAGQLLACGRQFRHPSSQNWAVVDATSGFARLVLTVDLTKTSTKEAFEQIIDSIEYASSEDGFPELEQTDINTSGTRYQVVACVVSLGTGGITGIVSQLGPCEGTGGGGLNFSVVGGLTQPANPKENMIWVPTDVDITGYSFSATEPAASVEGMVWITIGTSSTAEFNALKKNEIRVYPIKAKQYISGAWVDAIAKSYHEGKWVDWLTYLYHAGDQCTYITGGWEQNPNYFSQASGDTKFSNSGSVTFGANSITVTSNSGNSAIVSTKKAVDFTPYSKLKFDVVIGNFVGYYISLMKDGAYNCMTQHSGQKTYNESGTHEMDISGISGSFFVCIVAHNGRNVESFDVWLES